MVDKKKAIKTAKQVIREYNPKFSIPFPFENIDKRNENIEIFTADLKGLKDEFGDISGLIRFKDDVSKIYVDRNKPEKRQYFTIAHELGHFFLHIEDIKSKGQILDRDYVLLRSDNTSLSSEKEVEANCFAAELLMPENIVGKVFKTLNSIEDTAMHFYVSNSAMSIRLETLGLIS